MRAIFRELASLIVAGGATFLLLISSAPAQQAAPSKLSDVKEITQNVKEVVSQIVGRGDKSLPAPEDVKERIDLWRGRVLKKLADIDRLTKNLNLRKPDNQKLAVDELVALLVELDLEAGLIVETYASFQSDYRIYRSALADAPLVFQAKALELEKKGSEARSPLIQESYADFAAQARKFATAFVEEGKALDSLEGDVAKQIETIKESRVLIADISGLLAAVPLQGGLEVQKFTERVNQYLSTFQTALQAVKGVGQKIGEPATKTPSPNPNSVGESLQRHRERLSQATEMPVK